MQIKPYLKTHGCNIMLPFLLVLWGKQATLPCWLIQHTGYCSGAGISRNKKAIYYAPGIACALTKACCIIGCCGYTSINRTNIWS
ncbi:unnamed protein product [Urochloa humidicola]